MKNKLLSIVMLLVLAVTLIPRRSAEAAPLYDSEHTYTSQPNETAGTDTRISSSSPTSNFETNVNLGVGEVTSGAQTLRTLIAFDLSSIPTNATVTSATLTIWIESDGSDNARTLRAFRLKRAWVESQATWNVYATGSSWGTAGAGNSTDAETTDVGSAAITSSQAAGDPIDIALDVTSVQEMVTGTFANHGWLLKVDTESDDQYTYRSSNSAASAERPKLVIEYTLPDPVDPGWICREVGSHEHECPDPNDPISPFVAVGGGFESSGGNVTAATLNCTPYPGCLNDYPIYFRVEGTFTWTKSGAPGGPYTVDPLVQARGGPEHTIVVPCGSGNSGSCEWAFSGIIETSELPTTGAITDHTVLVDIDTNPEGMSVVTDGNITYDIYLSLLPFDEGCLENYYLLSTDGPHLIVPTIESPVGDPTDEQVLPVSEADILMISTEGGPWDDGADDRWDAAVSWDGSTWISLAELSASALCVVQDPTHPDLMTIFIMPESDEFHIRANDTAGNFADNLEVEEFLFTIGVAAALGPPACEAQFSYDTENDLMGSTEIDATSESVPAELDEGNAFLIEEWYAIEITAGSWTDNGGTPQTDLEYSWPFDVAEISEALTFTDLGGDTGNVWCTSTGGGLFFVQAAGPALYLRVDDADANFANNAGSVTVAIYHATFTRAAALCETSFQKGAYISSGTVGAAQENGVVFATALSDARSKDLVFGVGFEPGAWYVLETTMGPWRWDGSTRTQAAISYDLAIKINDEWIPFEEWSEAECVTPLDALGHVAVYFQAPVNEAGRVFELRVNDSASWNDNVGVMGWDIYQGTQLAVTNPDGSCDYSFDPESISSGRVYANKQDGIIISGMSVGGFYMVELLGNEHAWQESVGDTDQYGMQISHKDPLLGSSHDPNQSWFDLPSDYPGVLCSLAEDHNLQFFLKVDQPNSELPPITYRLRADSTTFINNTGYIDYRVYVATPGASIDTWVSCINEDFNPLVVTDHVSIPVLDEQGISLFDRARSTGLGSSISGSALSVGNSYIVQTMDGPWTDDEENEYEYEAELSMDAGETWVEITRDMGGVLCAEPDKIGRYWKVLFTVEDGQQWRIRVANDSGSFTDNGGHLAYRLYSTSTTPSVGSEFPENKAKFGTCDIAPVRPIWGATGEQVATGTDDGGEIPDPGLDLGEILVNIVVRLIFWFQQTTSFVAEWIDYLGAELTQYFAWCPRHTTLFLSATDLFWNVEPFATVMEWQALAIEIKLQLDGYNWDDADAPESVLGQGTVNLGSTARPGDPVGGQSGIGSTIREGDPGKFDEETRKYILPVLPSNSPWRGGPLIVLQPSHPTSYYTSCSSALTDVAGPYLITGVCAASALMRETGGSFYLQLLFDIMGMVLVFQVVKSGVVSIIELMVAVRITGDVI